RAMRGEGQGEGLRRAVEVRVAPYPALRAAFSPRAAQPRVLLLAADAEIGETAVEARQATAAVDQLLRAASPGRVGVRVDVEVQGGALLAIGRAGHELDAIGHDDLDHMIVGVNVGLHRQGLWLNKRRAVRRSGGSLAGRSIR